MNESDPICGNCGKPKSDHESHPSGLYCFDYTNGDLFTDDPSSELMADHIERFHPRLWCLLVAGWKVENGHVVDNPRA